MKVFFKKQKPNVIQYRDYKKFDNNSFMKDIQDKFLELTHEHHSLSFEIFKSTTYQIFDNHVPLKKRYVRANQAPFINKNISKEIMKKTRLRNKFFNNSLDMHFTNKLYYYYNNYRCYYYYYF